MGSGDSKGTFSEDINVNNPAFQNAKVVTLDHKRVLQNNFGGV